MSRREKKQSEKEAEKNSLQNPEQQNPEFPVMFPDDEEIQLCTASLDEKTVNCASQLKGNIIDLNIQPERDDEVSSGSDSGGMRRRRFVRGGTSGMRVYQDLSEWECRWRPNTT